ncbi:MAG: fumarate reductase/succinate dehydrogenase flavoprotein [Frankiales bacterium]|nr:fumarate reductase/succinate dehydrogenase flavoprotein [Frankiales bacterium]
MAGIEQQDRIIRDNRAWDETVDVLVAGSGGAGLTAALTAADAGLSVLVAEKTSLLGGTTGVSGGTIWLANNHHVGEVGVEDSAEDATAYMRGVSAGTIAEDVLATLVEEGPRLITYLVGVGIGFEPFPSVGPTLDYRFRLPGAKRGGRSLTPLPFDLEQLGPWADVIRQGTTAGWVTDKKSYHQNRAYLVRPQDRPPVTELAPGIVGAGSALVGHLLKGCLDRGVQPCTDTAISALHLADGRVLGARLSGPDGDRDVRARAGVLLATGEFEWNEDLKRRLLARPLTHPVSAPVGDGDGLLLGLAAGADVAGLGDAWWTPAIDLGGAESPRGGGTRHIMCRVERGLPPAIIVNAAGRRFVNEATNYYDLPEAFGTFAAGTPNLPAWLVIDQQFRDTYPLVATASDGIAAPDPAWLTRAQSLPSLLAPAGSTRPASCRRWRPSTATRAGASTRTSGAEPVRGIGSGATLLTDRIPRWARWSGRRSMPSNCTPAPSGRRAGCGSTVPVAWCRPGRGSRSRVSTPPATSPRVRFRGAMSGRGRRWGRG